MSLRGLVVLVLAVVVVAVMAVGGCSAPEQRAATNDQHTLVVNGTERIYRVHVPRNAGARLPVVLVLHGGGGNGQQVEQQTGMSEAADKAGFIAVYPDGSGRTALKTWNSGNCCAYAHREKIDDVAFAAALLDKIIADYPADPARVFATGLSNGAMMSYRLACELSGRVSAIAPVAGALNVEPCKPTKPVSVLAIHGTDDELVPYNGGPPARTVPGTESWVNTSVSQSVGFWATHNACEPTPQPGQDGTLSTYRGCADGTQVMLRTVAGGGHAWPGGKAAREQADPPAPKPDASAVILDFFAHLPPRQ